MVRFPADVFGWLTECEGMSLARLAQDKRVLEIGSYLGRSTICLAQTATHVTAVDPFDGRATSKPCDTFAEFRDNLVCYNVASKVRSHVGTFAKVAPDLLPGGYDFVFIDGDHDYHAVMRDADLAVDVLKPGGLLVFHDYRTFPGEHDGRWDGGVTKAVDKLLANGAELMERAGTLAVVRPNGKPAIKPVVALAMPRGSASIRCSGSARAFYGRPTNRGISRVLIDKQTSLAIRCFNLCWVEALNVRSEHPITHFAMIHDDICPDDGWLDVLLDELDRTGADMLSVVVPIKNPTGITSTAVDMEGAPWIVRRLTMREVFALPETFGIEDIPWRLPESQLVVNTGLWVCRFDSDWVERVAFKDHARIVKFPDGTFGSQDISEDWDWSRQLHELGLKVMATRKVGLHHERPEFTNRQPWGMMDTDEPHFAYVKKQGVLVQVAELG